MSGGFFRGTSADQDTRFSNKQSKLLKSQKFPSELEHLVDMTKVKMDVIRPWIATRATELLGFEDEVLINFIYGLLDVKLVDGKKIQIQLTGFMEKNTGKFMKELWGLLLSAQNNVSGVPQPFLDAKEEETRKKKAETDRIASEIQKRREPERERERERERKSGFEGEADVFRSVNAAPESVPRHSRGRSSSIPREEEREANMRQSSRAINGRSRSPQPNDRSPSPYRSTTSPTRSTKKTIARSRSHSGEEPKSRNVSVSSHSQDRSVSPERQYESPARRSPSPKRRYRSPRRSSSPRRRRAPLNTESSFRRRSPRLRRRSTSRSRHRSPPYRQRSPRARQRSPPSPGRRSPSLSRGRSPSLSRRRSPSPLRRRSPLPLRRRSPSPLHRRSPSPLRHRSPILVNHRSRTPLHNRSPSPRRRRSPVKDRRRSPSPLRRRSPIRRRSPSPWRRSPLRRSPNRSPINHPMDSHSSPRQRKRGRSPYRSRSPLYRTRRSLSKERDGRLDGHSSRRHRDEHDSKRTHEQNSPVSHDLDRELAEHAGPGEKASEIVSRKEPVSLRSPQRDVGNQNDHHDKVSVAITENSPSQLDNPANTKKLNSRITGRFRSLSKSPVRQTRAKMPRRDNPGNSREEKETSRAREVLRHAIDSSGKRSDNSQRDAGSKRSYIDDHGPESNSPDRVSPTQSPATRGRPVNSKKSSGHRSDVDLSERHSHRVSYSSDDNGFVPKSVREESDSLGDVHDRQRSTKHHPKDAPILEEKVYNEKLHGYGVNDGKRPQELESIKHKVDKSIRRDTKDSDAEKTGSDKHHMEKRGHRRSDRRKRDSDESSESDSQTDDRKEAKRKRKDEKRLRKEEKRRRREEKHRKRLDRRAKQKVKSVDTVNPPSDFKGNDNDSDNSDVDANARKKFHRSDADELESEQKKLEIELRKKALESLRAKKAIGR